MTCEKCGKVLQVGEWPLCGGKHRHGVAQPMQIIGDDVPGGFVVENGFSSPQKFYSKSAHRKALDAKGLRMGAGKPKRSWASTDAQTLENARKLVERVTTQPTKSTSPDPSLTMRFEWRDVTC